MNILFLSRRFYPDVGGVEKHVFEIGKRFAKEGDRVVVITQSQGEEGEIKGIEIKRINKTSRNLSEKLHIWKWMFKNRKLIHDADVVHAHDVYFWYLPFRFMFPFKKSFVTFHGYETYPIKKKAIIIRKISEYLADGNIIVGDFIKKWYKTKPNFVIYGGVEISDNQAKLVKKESAVFIGRLDGHTGILEYTKAIDLIKNSIPNFKFTIVGDGELKSKLIKQNITGFKKNSLGYLRKSNFAFASRYLSILEALANKKLVFAQYDNPVKEDYLKMAPFSKFIVICKSPEEIAVKVLYYLKHSKEEEGLKQSGFEWVKNRSWDNVMFIYKRLWFNEN